MDDVILEQLRTAEALLGEGDGLMAVDTSLRIVFWGEQMEGIFGIRADRALGCFVTDALPFLTGNGGEGRLREVLAGKRVTSGERPFEVPGTRRGGVYEARGMPLCDGARRIVGVSAVVRDVTERSALAARLRETESRFRNMADASPVLLWMSGTDSFCTFFNQTWLTFTGRTLEQEQGVGWAEGVHFEDLSRCLSTYERAFSARQPFEMEYRLRRFDGEYRWLLDRGAPRFTNDGAFAGYIGSCVDITDHKDIEARLRQSVREREDFLSVASHELRTPLTTLLLALEKLVRDGNKLRKEEDDALQRIMRHATRAVSQAQRLDELVEDLLDITRLVSGRIDLALASVDLATIVDTSIERIAEAARRAGSSLVFSPRVSVTGRWDPSRLERVVINLLSNAVKYGNGKPVQVGLSAETDCALLTVRDEGIGIDPGDQSRIFGRFERAVSGRNYSGFGLGLWIVREIVQVHQGAVRVASAPGAGATFTVSLPREAAAPLTRSA